MDERPVAARMQGRAFVPLFFIFCLFYRKEIVFIFGRQGFGKEDAGDGKGTAGKETAGDLGQSGTCMTLTHQRMTRITLTSHQLRT